jgi:hypothetical protein
MEFSFFLVHNGSTRIAGFNTPQLYILPTVYSCLVLEGLILKCRVFPKQKKFLNIMWKEFSVLNVKSDRFAETLTTVESGTSALIV